MASPNDRLTAFSDGVFAIAITLLILEIKVPPLSEIHSTNDVWIQVGKLWPSFFAFTLSFIIILIAWVGHHNLVVNLHKTSSPFQFANGYLLLTVVVYPFPTSFMAEYLDTPFYQPSIVCYCIVGLLHNIGWILLLRSILFPHPLVPGEKEIEIVRDLYRGARFGFVVNSSLVILAWFFPIPALILSVMLWIYWLYISVKAQRA